MRAKILDFICCVYCQSELVIEATAKDPMDAEEILEGHLTCSRCQECFPIHQGVPRMLPKTLDPGVSETAENFGNEWNLFSTRTKAQRDQLVSWLKPLPPGFFVGKTIVDFGCGMGRNPLYFAEEGAKTVVGIDVSHAVDVAYKNCRDHKNIHIVQADIYNPPLKQVFEFAFSLGVLHHLPDPGRGFAKLVHVAKPGATVFVWVYGLENNEWIVKMISPIRKLVTSRLSVPALRVVSKILTTFLYLLIHGVYVPLHRFFPSIGNRLFYNKYLMFNSQFAFYEIDLIVYDQLTAPIAHYVPRNEVEGWFQEQSVKLNQINWYNENSWTAIGLK